MESFASNTRNPYSIGRKGKLFQEGTEENDDTSTPPNDFLDLQSVNYSKKLVTSTLNTTIKTLAAVMTKKKVGAMLILKDKLPIGIITDKDIRNKIATGEFPITRKPKIL